MVKKITKEWLESEGACQAGITWFIKQSETEPAKLLHALWTRGVRVSVHATFGHDSWLWGNWLLIKIFPELKCCCIQPLALLDSIGGKYETSDDECKKSPSFSRTLEGIQQLLDYIEKGKAVFKETVAPNIDSGAPVTLQVVCTEEEGENNDRT